MISQPTKKPGFTITELLVSIGLLGILLSILLPAVGGAKARAGELKSLSNARGIAMSMQAYADTFGVYSFARAGESPVGTSFPFPEGLAPEWDWVPWREPNGGRGYAGHWPLSTFWPGLVGLIAPWSENEETWRSPGQDRDADIVRMPSYEYSNSFIASPSLWMSGTPIDNSLLAPTTPSMVSHPTRKVLVWDDELAYLSRRPEGINGFLNHGAPMAFVDQHAEVRNPLDAVPGFPNPLAEGRARQLHDTPAGVLGRDFE